MQLWWLDPIDIDGSPHRKYDCQSFIVVRAENSEEARKLAATIAADETPECWLNEQWSTCVPYTFPTTDGDAEVVWSEFHPG